MSGHQIAMALRRAYLAMHRRTDAVLARHGVTADQFVLLSALVEGQALTQRELADRTASDPNTVRAMLVLLQVRRLITRAPNPSDRRARIVALTPLGRTKYRALWTATESVRERLAAVVKTCDAAEILDRLTSALSSTTV